MASPEREFVVDLKKIGKAHALPTTQQALGHGLVVFAPLGINKNPMVVKVDHMKRIETSIVLDIPGAQKIGLVDVVGVQRFSEIGIFHPFGGIGSFF